jgi:hypothetical protein
MASSTGILNPKDYALSNLLLLTADSTFDLKNMMIEVGYTEDLFNNVNYGYVVITEASGYIETLALMGNEFLRLTFSKTGEPYNQIDKVFRVFKLSKRQLEGTTYKESYVLNFCSEELLLSSQYKISKAYNSQTVSSMVTDILQNYLNVPAKRIGTIEPSYGNYSFILPTISAFDAINWISIYARPNPSNPGADMVFYEDKNGYNFRSLQTMMLQQPYYTYTYRPKNINSSDINSEVFNVTTYEILNSYDSLGAINSGVFANQLISVNPITRQRKVTNFDYNDYQNRSKKLNPYPITNNFKNRFGDGLNQAPQGLTKLVFSNYDSQFDNYISSGPASANAPDIFAETYIPYRTAQLALANYTRVKISVPGDPNITVGSVIKFDLTTKRPESSDNDKYYSGNYMITAVKHQIGLTEYKTILEITKESVPNEYPSIDTNSALWQNTGKDII